MEECFGPLKSYMSQSVVINLTHPARLRFRTGLLEMIEIVYQRFNFVIARDHSQLGENIKFIIENAEGRREREPINLMTIPKLYPIHPELNFSQIKKKFEDWRELLIKQVETAYNIHEAKINNNIAIRESRWKLIKLLLWK